ncbi:Nramp family divalent metal transporter [Arenibacter sp. GZD96]|uniref:Nramp family divalent metal transporter n=1 Tax=Aurantibrevibacter litoralis TaxID=3106030 RepID=UPI002AFF26F1|nr:Nramp family divalent metal transporter [Arenibacter sp. GZD-96]MEA1785045.1 Nramp family divalent metal transporter [Arenibacter sp. GZD-96]
MSLSADPYVLSADKIKEPPHSFQGKLKFLGPGFILSASIVGSGELIATTALGAEAGFITFWVIIISCIVKVMVQLEFGKHTILTGETAMQAFNKLPGPRFGKAKWSVWTVLLVMVIKLLQVGGIVGGVAIILHMSTPLLNVTTYCFLVAIVVALMIFRGYYKFIESVSLGLIGFFTLFTIASLYFLKFTPYAISWEHIWSGLQFHLPKTALAVAFGAFGITGVGGDEIIHYNYWCLEKGYASYTGKNDNSEAWRQRAKGWIKVMQLDAVFAMCVYTAVTACFYLLGAAVLHTQDTVMEGYGIIETLSTMYTESLGPNAKTAFLLGALVTLFSTLFAALAAWTRQLTDIFGQLGWIDFGNFSIRKRTVAILAWVIPILWAVAFVFIQLPVMMVITGGIVGSFLLFLVVYAAFYFRYYRVNPHFKPNFLYDLLLWISILSIVAVGTLGIFKFFS